MSTRRTIIFGAAGLLVVGGAAAGLAIATDTAGEADIKRIVQKYLEPGGLKVEGLDEFARDYLKDRPQKPQERAFSAVDVLLGGWASEFAQARGLLDQRDRPIITAFLFGSDMFQEPKPPGSTVRYLGRQDLVCSTVNPFAQFL
jgi:hypothetical protein